MKQYIGRYLNDCNNYVLVTGEDEEDALDKFKSYLILNNIYYIPMSIALCKISAVIL
jgi:hypothetical protein